VNHDIDIVLTLAIGFVAALVLGLLTHRLRMSPIVGYLLAGILVGPFTPGVVVRTEFAQQFAEVGVILLMFGVGLHFHLSDLLAVKKVALPGALAQIVAATGLGALVGHAFGWSLGGGIVFGLAISVASTVVLLRVLSDHNALHTPRGHIAVGWLVLEDLFTVLVLVLLPVLFGTGKGGDSLDVARSIAVAVLKISALVLVTWLLGRRGIPKLLSLVARTQSRELFTLAVLALALGIAVASVQFFGASMALGAFLAGMIVGQSEFSQRAASDALPMRDAFAVLFFVSVGMLVNPAELGENIGLIAATIAVVVAGKALVALGVVLLLRQPLRTALTVAVALAQIGEFSFILGNAGTSLGLLPPLATQALVATSIVSITLNPVLYRAAERLAVKLGKAGASGTATPAGGAVAGHTAIVIGYGPVGETVAQLLLENGIEPRVIELNQQTAERLRERGIFAVHGDASQREVLERAGVHSARSLIFAASGTPAEDVVRTARALNPNLRILARTTYLRDKAASQAAGADNVVAAEAEVALAFAEILMRELGATPDQTDRARERVRSRVNGETNSG
jgi:monovalent cation:H+ antiporter-2, CPA2 family